MKFNQEEIRFIIGCTRVNRSEVPLMDCAQVFSQNRKKSRNVGLLSKPYVSKMSQFSF